MKHVILPQCYGGISGSNTQNISASSASTSSLITEKDSKSVAGSSPVEDSGSSEMMGTAVFNSDKLVGELTAIETMYHLLIRNDIESCLMTIPNPNDSNDNIDLFLSNRSRPKIRVNIVNGLPLIKIDLKFEARILSVNSNSDYDSEAILQEISTATSQYMERTITEYLYKTSTKLQSDIDGFGRYALSLFSTTSDFNDYQWLSKYKDATFDVTIDTKVGSAFLLGGDK